MISRSSSNTGHLGGLKLGHTAQLWKNLVNTVEVICFYLTVMKIGQDACLGNNSDEFDGSGERSRAILALLYKLLYFS
jgi:hypothetical protein